MTDASSTAAFGYYPENPPTDLLVSAQDTLFAWLREYVCGDMVHRLSNPDPAEIRYEVMRAAERLIAISLQLPGAQQPELEQQLAVDRANYDRQ